MNFGNDGASAEPAYTLVDVYADGDVVLLVHSAGRNDELREALNDWRTIDEAHCDLEEERAVPPPPWGALDVYLPQRGFTVLPYRRTNVW